MSSADGGKADLPIFNTAAVVQRTGVPAATFRAWERRYGYPLPHREPSGQRLYSDRDIEAIRWLDEQTREGVSISRAVDMLRRGYARPTPAIPNGRRVMERTVAEDMPRSFDRLQRDLTDALVSFDAVRSELILSEAFALFPVQDVCLNLLQPVLEMVGDRWRDGSISVAEEHYATAYLRSRLFALINAYSMDEAPGEPLVITACGPGEWHEVGILMVTLFLARRGFKVRYLGPDLPVAELEEPLRRLAPALLVLSAQSEEAAGRLSEVATVLARLPEPRPLFAYGGRVFNEQPGLRERVTGTYLGEDARQAVATVELLLSTHTSAAA